ncbi:hypothetical protein diail_5086 [Diaporthe ilicicola]|nr:hypothetical protein diail_5086 [Diaporthe ilicicola]
MERPAKRQRIALGSLGTDDEDEDELDCEPNELNQRRDPAYQLEQARNRASNKLKSRFEDIFAKYEKDFTGVGDEIKLSTGEVVVNNGHLQSIAGVQAFGDGDSDDDSDDDQGLSRNKRSVHATDNGNSGNGPPGAAANKSPGGAMRLSSMMFPARESLMASDRSFDFRESGRTQGADPAWQAPELPRSAFLSPRSGAQAQQYRLGTGQSTKKVARRSLLRPRGQDGDEEDVLGVPDNALRKQESPLIKDKFPAVSSSPNNDAGLHAMIQDVIENIADTSPLAEKPRKGSPGTRARVKTRMKPVRSDSDIRCQVAVASPANAGRIRKTRKPKALLEQQTALTTGQPEISGTDEDSFLDVTGNTPAKPAGQLLYVEIKARKLAQADCSSRKDLYNDEAETIDRHSFGIDSPDQKMQQSSLSSPLDIEVKSADSQKQNGAAGSAASDIDPETMKPRSDAGTFDRRHSKPASAVSDGGNLPAKKPRNQKHAAARAGDDGQAYEDSPPTVPQQNVKESFERNVVDPSYAFSDEENLLPRRKKSNQRNSEPASRANLAAQDTSRVGTGLDTEAFLQEKVALDTSNQARRNRAARILSKSVVECDTVTDKMEVFKSSQVRTSEHLASDDPPALPSSAPYRRSRSKRSNEAAVEQPGPQATEEMGNRTLKGGCQRKSGDRFLGPLGLGHKPDSGPADTEIDGTSTKLSKAAVSAQVPPSTPQSKSKPRSEKTASPKLGLISLLSDGEDEEDEISFNHADFTPSGHHRILTLRPHHHQPATASTAKKRHGGGLLFGSASTSKINKHSTPGSDSRGKKKSRRSTDSLAGSVVRVRRESFRASSPAGSVIQTPGGTTRRCGKDGFRCERDFCFVCISI